MRIYFFMGVGPFWGGEVGRLPRGPTRKATLRTNGKKPASFVCLYVDKEYRCKVSAISYVFSRSITAVLGHHVHGVGWGPCP